MEEAKNKSFRKLLADFMGYTTSHGLGRLVESTTILWKIFWILSCLGALVMFVHQVHALFTMYLSRPVQTYVTIKFEKQLDFPAVTICNLNMFKKDKLPNELVDIIPANASTAATAAAKTKEPAPTGAPVYKPNTTTYAKKIDPVVKTEYNYSGIVYKDDIKTSMAKDEHYTELSEEYQDESVASEETKLRRRIELRLGGVQPEVLFPDGHALDDLVKNCSWKGLDCKRGEFTQHWTRSWNYRYGNCYTFNNGVDQDKNPIRTLKASKSGPSQGLVLHMDIEPQQYVGALTQEAGVRVTLHEQGVMAFPYEEGFSVPPGMATSIGLRKGVISRLDRFGDGSCLKDAVLSEDNIYRKYRNSTRYSQQACLYSCLGQTQRYTCGCSENMYPSKHRPCDVFDQNERQCLKIVKHLFNKDELACIKDCKRPCREQIYLKTISSSEWPSNAYKEYLKTKSNQNGDTLSNLQLNIFFSQLNYETVEEKFSYGTTNLLADIGGQLGLWIGISALTCCELLELILKLLTLALAKFKSRNHVIEIKY